MALFFFNDTATTEIYTLSLHDALPIFLILAIAIAMFTIGAVELVTNKTGPLLRQPWFSREVEQPRQDRKSTRLNSSHANISYAVFCLKKIKTELDSLPYRVSTLLNYSH